MNDNYVKFKFKIQFLHICHESNNNSLYTVSVYEIYSIITLLWYTYGLGTCPCDHQRG